MYGDVEEGRDWEGHGKGGLRLVEEAPGRQMKGRQRSGVRGWLKATGRARGVQEGDARGKCLGHRLEFRLERREQGTE